MDDLLAKLLAIPFIVLMGMGFQKLAKKIKGKDKKDN